jgi:DNA-binding transcriptional ArsR family regulator
MPAKSSQCWFARPPFKAIQPLPNMFRFVRALRRVVQVTGENDETDQQRQFAYRPISAATVSTLSPDDRHHEEFAWCLRPSSRAFRQPIGNFFIGLCVALGQFEEKPFSVTKIAAYMRVPRTTVTRRLGRLQDWGLIHRQGHHYYMDQMALNSLLGMRSYQHIRRLLDKSAEELTVLDTLPD